MFKVGDKVRVLEGANMLAEGGWLMNDQLVVSIGIELSLALLKLEEKILSLELENVLEHERELEIISGVDNLKPSGIEPPINLGGNAWVW